MQKMTLRALRTNYSLTAKEVADKLGIHQQTLLKYENDSTDIPLSLLEKLAKYYGVNKDFIFLGKKFVLKQNFNKHLSAGQKGTIVKKIKKGFEKIRYSTERFEDQKGVIKMQLATFILLIAHMIINIIILIRLNKMD